MKTKDLTRNQRESINKMTICDKHKKLARKIVRFINNFNQSILGERKKFGNDKKENRYTVQVNSTIISILDKSCNFRIDVWLNHDSNVIIELEVDKKSYAVNAWFIHYEIFKVVFEE